MGPRCFAEEEILQEKDSFMFINRNNERHVLFVLPMPDKYTDTSSDDYRHAAPEDICRELIRYAHDNAMMLEITHRDIPVKCRLDGRKCYIRLMYDGMMYRFECIEGRK
jgi:hypothetical protein